MPSTPFKGFALVDCNNFYVSCERVFKPHLEKVPAVVLSNNDSCIIARSKEIKELGIPMGAPLFEYKALLEKHKAHLFSPNFSLYADMSERVMSTLYQFSNGMQPYSIDEAFIPFTIESLEDFIFLQRKVKKWTGIPVSIGLAPTKTLAKIANQKAKKMELGVFSLMNPKEQESILKDLSVGEIWGIGKKSAEKLKHNRIYTADQLKNTSEEWIKKKLHLPGLRTLLELKGIPCYYPEIQDEAQKSLTYSKTFASPITSFGSLKETLVHYISKAAEKLRSKSRLTQIISLYLRKEGSSIQKSLSLTFPTNATPILIEGALNLLNQLYQQGIYKKAGICFFELTSEKEQQLNFRSNENPNHSKLMQTLDQVNAKYGNDTLFYAAQGFKKPWISKRERLSPEYTTKLSEILEIDL